jgi:hypothetical protein
VGVGDNNVQCDGDPGGWTEVTTLEPASPRDRLAATGLDLLLVLGLGALSLRLTGSLAPGPRLAALVLAIGIPTMLTEGVLGRTLGKAGLGLRHGRPEDGRHPLSVVQIAGRFVLKWIVPTLLLTIGLWFAAAVWWVALFVPMVGPTHRAAHDRLTRSSVLGRPPQQRAEGA